MTHSIVPWIKYTFCEAEQRFLLLFTEKEEELAVSDFIIRSTLAKMLN
jgi:hypothetical protein